MTISPTNNSHTLSRMIIWQYEHSPRIVRWFRSLSSVGYCSCGKVFDDIIAGILSIISSTNTIGMWISQTLIASKGFNWKSGGTGSVLQVVGHEVEFLKAFYYSRFIGVGNYEEFLGNMGVFGLKMQYDQNSSSEEVKETVITDPDEVLVRVDDSLISANVVQSEGSESCFRDRVKNGMPIPLSVYCDYAGHSDRESERNCFEFGKQYYSSKQVSGTANGPMRLCTDDEKSFYKINNLSSDTTTATISDVKSGTLLTRRSSVSDD